MNTSVVGTVAVVGHTVALLSLRVISTTTPLAAMVPSVVVFRAKQLVPKALPKVICTLGLKEMPRGFEQLTAIEKSFELLLALTPVKALDLALPNERLEGTVKLQVL